MQMWSNGFSKAATWPNFNVGTSLTSFLRGALEGSTIDSYNVVIMINSDMEFISLLSCSATGIFGRLK